MKRYGLIHDGMCSTAGFKTFEEALRHASESLSLWVAEHGGGDSLEVCAYETVAKIGIDTTLPARSEDGPTLAGLIDELAAGRVETAGNGETVGTAGRWAGDVCRVMCLALDIISTCCLDCKVGKDAALEADRADKAGDGAEADPQGVGGVAADRNELVSGAEVEAGTKRVQILRLLDAFALEFVGLALEFYKPRFGDGEIFFQCGDLLAAQKRAEALKRLAGAIDKFKHGDCTVDDFHAAIIADFGRETGHQEKRHEHEKR